LLTIFFLVALTRTGISGSFDIPAGSREAGLGFIYSVIRSPFAGINNQACLVTNVRFSAAISHHQLYLTGNLSYSTIATSIKAGRSNIGFGLSQSGFDGFRSTMLFSAAGIRLSESLSGGIGIQYYYTKADESGIPNHAVSYSAGLILNLSHKVLLGIHSINPVNLYNDHGTLYNIPSRYTCGLLYNISENIRLMAEIEKAYYTTPRIRFGLEFGHAEKVQIRTGLQLIPFMMSFGTSFNIGGLLFEIALSYHEYLGFTPSSSMVYNGTRKK